MNLKKNENISTTQKDCAIVQNICRVINKKSFGIRLKSSAPPDVEAGGA